MPGPGNIKSNTGNATIRKQGHTTDGKFGSSPDVKGFVQKGEPRELNAK